MRILLKGTMDQIREACATVAKAAPRDRTKQLREGAYEREKNGRESALMREAYLAVKDDSSQRTMKAAFASAIYGERTDSLIDVAKAIVHSTARKSGR